MVFTYPTTKEVQIQVGFIYIMMVKIGALLMVEKGILFVSIPMLRNHHITMRLDMVKLLMKHYKDCMTGVLKMDL